MKQAWKRPARASSRTRRTVEHRTDVQRTALAGSSAAGMRREDQKVGAWDRPRTADVSRLGRGSISAALHRSHRGKASRDESTVISQNHASILRRRRQLLRLRLLRRRVLRLRRFRLRRLRLRRWR